MKPQKVFDYEKTIPDTNKSERPFCHSHHIPKREIGRVWFCPECERDGLKEWHWR